MFLVQRRARHNPRPLLPHPWRTAGPHDPIQSASVRGLAFAVRYGIARLVPTAPAQRPPARARRMAFDAARAPEVIACGTRPLSLSPRGAHVRPSAVVLTEDGMTVTRSPGASGIRCETAVVYVSGNARSRRSLRRALGNATEPNLARFGPDCEQLGTFLRDAYALLAIMPTVVQWDCPDGTTAFQVVGLPDDVKAARSLPTVRGSHHALAVSPPRPQRTDPLAPARCDALKRMRRAAAERGAEADRENRYYLDRTGRRWAADGTEIDAAGKPV